MEDVPSSNCLNESLGGPTHHQKKRGGVRIKFEINPLYILLSVFTLLALFILKDFISSILLAAVISYLSYPLYKRLLRRTGKTASALITILVVVLVISVPSVFVITELLGEIRTIHTNVQGYISTDFPTVECEDNFLCGMLTSLGFTEPNAKEIVSSGIRERADLLYRGLFDYTRIFNYISIFPAIFLNIFLIMFMTFYLLIDGEKLVERVKPIVPLRSSQINTLTRSLKESIYAVVYGNIVVAVIQGLLTLTGFLIFGVASPFTWGIVTVFTSLIPILGAVVVWLPASLFLMVSGLISGDFFTIARGVGLFFFGLFLISGIDNVLKPRLIGRRANLHPVLVFLGAIGGIASLGVIGFIIGPVLVALAVTSVSIASKYRNSD